MTEHIDHAREAVAWTEETMAERGAMNDDRAMLTTQLAQVHATLALAEQQRIANLIALYQADSDILDDPRFDAAKADIRKALGLS
ncbi:hypothetical protein D9V30_00155 [Mycetocola reblochoni]|uniref:Uncharacterized protein n=1 Tax=Mycetocola reblochoni TaxID=331618 RepID=A0A3L6ZSN5_9MICO|nr:hypothetical protein [Mycetocola reblochoni]RLP70884.1 hypothetical protein D9V30_00155 [Mycetocola reblochoni]